MRDYINKWTVKRVLQLGVGLFFIYYYTEDHNTMALVFGIIMSVQALFNIGCFSSKGCDTNNDSIDKQDFAKKIKKLN